MHLQKDSVYAWLIPGYACTIRLINHPEHRNSNQFWIELAYRYIPLTFFFHWLFSLIPPIGTPLYIGIILAAAWHLHRSHPENGPKHALEFLVITHVGFLGFRSFIGHTLMADIVATSIGWPTGSMFQIELAFYHLGLALATLYYIKKPARELLIGLIIAKSTFLLGAMGVHVYELFVHANTNISNIGPGIIYSDLILPLLLIYLVKETSRSRRRI